MTDENHLKLIIVISYIFGFILGWIACLATIGWV